MVDVLVEVEFRGVDPEAVAGRLRNVDADGAVVVAAVLKSQVPWHGVCDSCRNYCKPDK